jgi:hypothetical protein
MSEVAELPCDAQRTPLERLVGILCLRGKDYRTNIREDVTACSSSEWPQVTFSGHISSSRKLANSRTVNPQVVGSIPTREPELGYKWLQYGAPTL